MTSRSVARLAALVCAAFLACGDSTELPTCSSGATCVPVDHVVGGIVTGLVGSGLVLRNSGGDDLPILAAGHFAFATPVPAGSPFDVSVVSQPVHPSQTCAVSNARGRVGIADVGDVAVICTTDAFKVGVEVSGLAGTGLVLTIAVDGGAQPLAVSTNGVHWFEQRVESGAGYLVALIAQPANPTQTCSVEREGGAIDGADVTVAVTCRTNAYVVGGAVGGLAGSGLVLATAGEPNVAVAPGAKEFSFPDALASGTSYDVAVVQQPADPWQTCVVKNGGGIVGGAVVTSISVECTTNAYPVGGTIEGLEGYGFVLATPGEPDLQVPARAQGFEFALPLASGKPYEVTVRRHPGDPTQVCSIANGSSTVRGEAVTNVAVKCVTTYALGGSISGLVGSGLVLATADEPPLAIEPGATSFRFATRLPRGAPYDLRVAQQPTGPSQTCSVANGSGTMSHDVATVAVTCRSAWARVAASETFTAGVRPDGSLWTWGLNDQGQLGTGDFTDSAEPVRLGSDFVDVTAGSAHALALKSDGSLWAWGDNSYGQLGVDSAADPTRPSLVGSGFVSVAAGSYFTVAVKGDGTLWQWGDMLGQSLGYRAMAPVAAVVAVASGVDGGVNGGSAPFQVGTGFARVAAGPHHALAIKEENGTLWAWGDNSSGQLGLGDAESPYAPQQVGEDGGYVSAAAGGIYTYDGEVGVQLSHSVAVRSDGTLWAWGDDSRGQLGVDTDDTWNPSLVGSGFASVTAGGAHTLAVKGDGTLWAWGSNDSGELGTGDTASRSTPVQVGRGVAFVAAGPYDSFAVARDGALSAWGDNRYAQLGVGDTARRPSPVQVAGTFAAVSAGSAHTAAIDQSGGLWAWGWNGSGQLGAGDTADRGSPLKVGDGFAAVAAGGWHTLAVKTDGTLWAWGANWYGQLGTGDTELRTEPVQVGSAFVSVSAGLYHSFAIDAQGRLWAWGQNWCGQLGNGDTTDQHVPIVVKGSFASVSAGRCQSIGVGADGSLWGWGSNWYGELGLGEVYSTTLPMRTLAATGSTFEVAEAGEYYSMAVATDGTLWGMGFNWYGQLGTGNASWTEAPIAVGTGYASAAAAYDHTIALRTDGTVVATGANDSGQLGTGDVTWQTSFAPVATGFASVTTGSSHSAALKKDGTLWTWGNNYEGELGIGVLGYFVTAVGVP